MFKRLGDEMVRAGGYMFSFLLHATLAWAVLCSAQFGMLPSLSRSFIEVEIVTPTMPAPPLPAHLEGEGEGKTPVAAHEAEEKPAEPPKPEPPVKRPAKQAALPRPAQPPASAQASAPDLAPEQVPVQPRVHSVRPLSSLPPPKPISPVKSADAPKIQAVEPELSDHMHLAGGSGTQDYMKHGAESRFSGVQKIFADKFGTGDFVGQYQTNGKRSVSIIDARDTYGRLFLYDPRSGLLRALKETDLNRFIYTYGPETFEDEPVQGSVTFLPGEDRINRFIWLPGNGTAEFPNRIDFDEREVSFTSRGDTLRGTLIKPAGPGPHPAVVWLHDATCASRLSFHGFARMLALKGVAVLVYDARGCGDSGGDYRTATVEAMAEDALAAVHLLQREKGIDPRRVGLWGREAGALAAVRAEALSRDPGFVVAAFESAVRVPESRPPTPDEISKINADTLWVLSGPKPGTAWNDRAALLRDLREHGKPFTIALVRLDPVREGMVAGDDPDPLKRLSPWYMENAVPWILERNP